MGLSPDVRRFFAKTIIVMLKDCENPIEGESALQWLETVGVIILDGLNMNRHIVLREARRRYRRMRRTHRPGCRINGASRPAHVIEMRPRPKPSRPAKPPKPSRDEIRERLRHRLKTHTLVVPAASAGR